MNRNYLKISTLVILCSLLCFGFILGCKNAANPLGPYDVPTATPTYTNTPTNTATSTITATVNTPTATGTPTNTPTPGAVNVSVIVNYPAPATAGVNWNLIDPNGNQVGSSTSNNTNTFFSFNPSLYGVYTISIPAQGIYGASSTPVTISGMGNYSGNFNASNFSISPNPTSYSYQSSIGYQIPATVTYSQFGNLNIPVSVVLTGLPSAFGQSVSYLQLNNNGASAAITLYRNACYINNTSLQFFAYRLDGVELNASSVLPISREYGIPVTVFYSYNAEMPSVGTGAVSVIFNVFDQGLNCSSYEPYSFSGSGNADTSCCTGSVQFNGISGVSIFQFGEAFPVTAVIQCSGAVPGRTSGGFSIPVSFGYPSGQISTTLSFLGVLQKGSSNLGQTALLFTTY